MSFASEADKAKRKPVTMLGLKLDRCALTEGTAPCTSTATGDDKCFQAFQDCNDIANFDNEPVTVWFSYPQDGLPAGIFPVLRSMSEPTTESDLGRALGRRGSFTAELNDFAYHERHDLGDKSIIARSYDTDQGTYWGKLIARNNQSLLHRPAFVARGFIAETGFDWADFEIHEYVLETIDGPSDGKVRVKGADPLQKLDSTLIPPASKAQLALRLLTTDTDMLVYDPDGDIVDSSGRLQIGSSHVDYTGKAIETIGGVDYLRITGISFNSITGAEVKNHDEGALVQPCILYDDVTLDELYADILNRCEIESRFIPSVDWQAEVQRWLRMRFTRALGKPTEARKLIPDILHQSLCHTWYDIQQNEIRLKAIHTQNLESVVGNFDSDTGLADIDLTTDISKQITRVVVYYDPFNDVKTGNSEENFKRRVRYVNADMERPEKTGKDLSKVIYADWIKTESAALRLAFYYAKRFELGERKISFSLDVRHSAIWIGDIVTVTLPQENRQDKTGAPASASIEVTRSGATGHKAIAQKIKYEGVPILVVGTRLAYYADPAGPNYDAASESQRNTNGYYSDSNGVGASNDEPYGYS